MSMEESKLQGVKLRRKWDHTASARKKSVENSTLLDLSRCETDVEKRTLSTSKKVTCRTRKKYVSESPADPSDTALSTDVEITSSSSLEVSKKKPQKTQKKGSSTSTVLEDKPKKVGRGRNTKKKIDGVKDKDSETELSEGEGEDSTFLDSDESEGELDFAKDDGEDISDTYGWPPLVCCFGAAQHAFVPYGRPANRLLDYEIHERMKDALWVPEKFFRAPGGSVGSVATSLATLGGKVALMGKLRGDEYGRTMLYYLNVNNVQTRSVRVDNKRQTTK